MRILLIVQPERFDFYSYLNIIPNAECFLLWYEKPGQMNVLEDELPISFREIYYWTQFRTPGKLLDKIRPDRIIFFEIIDLRQIALNVASHAQKIPTFYLEHGAAGDRGTALKGFHDTSFKKYKLPYLLKRFKTSFVDVIRSKIFYFSVVKGFNSLGSYTKFLTLPFKMLKNDPNKVLQKTFFRERVPLKSIVFNKSNFEEFVLYTGISEKDAVFTGVPFFDEYSNSFNIEKEHVIFIDHPYLENQILGWTIDHHQRVAETLFHFASINKVKVFIKLHPRSKLEIWSSYSFDSEYIEILQVGDFTELYLTSKLILGFSSSLLNGFICAKKNIVLLGWHPEPQILGADFYKTGLCHYSSYPEELFKKYDYWIKNNLAMSRPELYEKFLMNFNFPFDGKATRRVMQTIIQDEALP